MNCNDLKENYCCYYCIINDPTLCIVSFHLNVINTMWNTDTIKQK